MRRTFTLINATLKSFIRNWTSIMMLIVFPLILISLLFFAFNPNGLQKIPIGVIGTYPEFDMQKYADDYFPYLSIHTYDALPECMGDIKLHKRYLCLEIVQESQVIVNVYYDNTQNVVIWEILNRIKSSIDYLQEQKSKDAVSDFLVDFSSALSKLEVFKQGIYSANMQLSSYMTEVDSTIIELSSARSDLGNTINSMDRDIADAKSTRNDIKREKDSMYSGVMTYFSNYESQLGLYGVPIDNAPKNFVNQKNREIDSKIYEFDDRLADYEYASAQGKVYMQDMSDGIVKLGQVKTDLAQHKTTLTDSYNEIARIQQQFQGIGQLNPETLINPIIVLNNPTYVPHYDSKDLSNVTVKQVVQGINMLSLQTIFPTMLFLITLFLALLIASFIALSDINSSAIKRVKLIKNIAVHNILSIYISSIIIISVPIFCVLLMGSQVFQLEIFSNFWPVFVLLFFVSSIFIILGMILAYIIRKESITLLTTTFLLILFIFLSGFILPTEKMSDTVGAMSNYFPGKIGIVAFDKIVFYEQGMSSISQEIQLLFAWILILVMLLVFIYHFNNNNR